MKIDTRNIMSVSQVNSKGTSWLVSQAEEGRTMLIMKNSEPTAVITSVENMTRLEEIDELASEFLCGYRLEIRLARFGQAGFPDLTLDH